MTQTISRRRPDMDAAVVMQHLAQGQIMKKVYANPKQAKLEAHKLNAVFKEEHHEEFHAFSRYSVMYVYHEPA